MRIIDFKEHTIIMTVGPTNCGKSYFAKQLLVPFFESKSIRYKYLSSDDKRRELLGEDIHKHNKRMNLASKQAFDLLHAELDSYTQYPINTPIIIVDATNLSKVARGMIYQLAEKNAYKVVALMFEYKDIADYVKYAEAGVNRKLVFDMVKKMKNDTSKEIERDKLADIYKIDSIDFSGFAFSYSNHNDGVRIEHDNFVVVGDVHGCYDEMIEMLSDNKGFQVDAETKMMYVTSDALINGGYMHHVFVGDLIDKGPKIREVIEFVYNNLRYFTIVRGNHESWVYKYLKGIIKPSPENDVMIEHFFNSVPILQEDAVLREKFFRIYDHSYTFAYNDKVVVTHAPCEAKYIGKNDKVSLKKQNTIMYPKKKDYADMESYFKAFEDFFSFLIRDGEFNMPTHVFGHIMLENVFQSKNKFGIDTGCYAGGMLSTLIFNADNVRPYVKKYKSRQPKTHDLYPLFRTKNNEVDINSLEHDMVMRLKWMAKNKVNFVSGTMSPTDKDGSDIESLAKGIEYYRSKGVTRIVLQPKFMGSRCNLLLHKSDVKLCKAFSRNAYEIKQDRIHASDTLENLFLSLQEKHAWAFEPDEDNGDKYDYVLFDGELLPWNVLGKDLIERDFMLAYHAASSENELLKSTDFENLYDQLGVKYTQLNASLAERPDLKLSQRDKDLLTDFGAFKEEYLDIASTEEALAKYKRQLDIFAAEAPLEFRPFAILKKVNEKHGDVNFINSNNTNSGMYIFLNDNATLATIDLETNYFDMLVDGNRHIVASLEELLERFWNVITQDKSMEGVVIKSDAVYVPGAAPYLKCRNKEYLRLVYGFDYDALPVKTNKLIKSKSTKRKLETSIKEWELGRQMLDIPMSEISIENKKWLSIAVQLIHEQAGESTLDPRL